MHNFEFLSSLGIGKKKNRNRQIIQDNLGRIKDYLENQDILNLKLTCRPFYYFFVTADIWVGLKLTVAEEKLQYFDDYEFEQAQTKQITRKDKNIRIHSLKKQTQEKVKKMPKREASNIKEKAKIMNENNQLLFRNTEIGFKRLLKTNSKKRVEDIDYDLKQSSDLPKIGKLEDYIIKISDPWSTNMSKAQNLINLFKRINEIHHKFFIQLKQSSKDIASLILKLKKTSQKSKAYNENTECQPYRSIINSTQGAKQNLLIDDQLNKVCRLFWNNHSNMNKIYSQAVSLMEILEKEKVKIGEMGLSNSKMSVNFVESLSNVDESVQVVYNFMEANKELGFVLAPQIINIYFALVQNLEEQVIVFQDTGQQTRIDIISWGVLSRKPFFWQTLFQIMVSLTSKLIKCNSSLCPDDITLSITVNKIKNIKTVSQSLLNISKYFGKIKKQIEQKQKKGKDSKTPDSIRQFLSFYEAKQDQNLYLTKNTAKLQKIIVQFKEKISTLKNKIQSN